MSCSDQVADKSRVELSKKLNASDQECEELKSGIESLKNQIELSQEKLERLQEQTVIQNQPSSMHPLENPTASNIRAYTNISKADSAFDDEFESMFRPVKELESSDEKLMDRQTTAAVKQLELLERGRHQLSREVKAAIDRAEAAEGMCLITWNILKSGKNVLYISCALGYNDTCFTWRSLEFQTLKHIENNASRTVSKLQTCLLKQHCRIF